MHYNSYDQHAYLKQAIRVGTSVLALMAAASIGGLAHAQSIEPATVEPSTDAELENRGEAESIVVTGTRVARSGAQMPTPTTVVGLAELQTAPRQEIADVLNTLPAFTGSTKPSQNTFGLSAGLTGVNALNLRSLGLNRTLVLLDGHRSVSTDANGVVDVSEFPQALVSRVEVVTGGASAAYGSDAVSGVVNFILDKKFSGIKGDVSGQISQHGDDKGIKATLTFGTPFAGGRGHFLLSGELSSKEALEGNRRSWMTEGRQVIQNPNYNNGLNGQPLYLFADRVGLNRNVPGGLITNTALLGTAFRADGTPYQFNFGTGVISHGFMSGGDWELLNLVKVGTIDPELHKRGVFGRVSYDLTDNIEVFAQASYNTSRSQSNAGQAYTNRTFTISRGNPFIPASVAAQMAVGQLNIPSIALGFVPFDLVTNPRFIMVGSDNTRKTQRYQIGTTGNFDALGTNWKFDAFYQKSIANSTEISYNNPNTARFLNALAAVTNGAGQIVCAINADAITTNDDPACAPYNPFGIGRNTQAAINYSTSSGTRTQKFTQDVAGLSLAGDPFSLPAGPVSVAFGVDWRKEQITGTPAGGISGLFSANNFPTFGKYSVIEGFIEAVVPVFKDSPLGQSLELNGAARLTHYSTSGSVVTWKGGLVYQPIDGLRFRGTISRDIRAPNLAELFRGGTLGSGANTPNPYLGSPPPLVAIPTRTIGNPALLVERALAKGFGVVLQPSFVPGLIASVDYWDIKISDAIGALTSEQIISQCFQTSAPSICSAIDFRADNRNIDLVRVVPFNIATEQRRGIDFELSYRMATDKLFGGSNGSLTFRAFATHNLKSVSNNGITAPNNTLASMASLDFATSGPPHWSYNFSLSYDNGPLKLSTTAYGFSAGKARNDLIECQTTCPASTSANPTVNINRVPGAIYFGLSGSYEVVKGIEAFASVQNLLDKDPAPTPVYPGNNPPAGIPTNAGYFDTLGRMFNLGVRFKF